MPMSGSDAGKHHLALYQLARKLLPGPRAQLSWNPDRRHDPPVHRAEGDLDSFASEASDAELITAVRGGDETGFATLWSRHQAAAHRLARQISNPSNADDLVSEAFLRVLHALQGGAGPDGAFRPYLFSTLRRINIDNGRSYYTRVSLTDDERDLDLYQSDSAADVIVDDARAARPGGRGTRCPTAARPCSGI